LDIKPKALHGGAMNIAHDKAELFKDPSSLIAFSESFG
jgi:hypothetical protein